MGGNDDLRNYNAYEWKEGWIDMNMIIVTCDPDDERYTNFLILI